MASSTLLKHFLIASVGHRMLRDVIISAVEYLNTRPYIAGLEAYLSKALWTIQKDIPVVCAERLQKGTADVGLVPVASLAQLQKYTPLSRWGIAADGLVDSVLVLSEVELQDIRHIWLDYQSRTSNLLLRILARDFFGSVELMHSKPGYEEMISGTTAGLVIGDRSLHLRSNFRYSYDLAELWKDRTSLPFIFALWVTSNQMDERQRQLLEEAFDYGLTLRDSLAKEAQATFSSVNVKKYFYERIHYRLGPIHHQGLEKFLNLSRDLVLKPSGM